MAATIVLTLAACGNGSAAESSGQPAPSGDVTSAASKGVKLKPVARLSAPTAIAAAPRDARRVFIAEQGGKIRVVRGGRLLKTPFLDISSRIQSGGEQGLLGLAFPPDYAQSKRFYVYFTANDGRQVLEEYRRRTPDRADPSSARRLFAHQDPESNHNGGQLQFGPDKLLYIATGDGGGAGDQHGKRGNAQNLGSPLGKLLRIDPSPSGGRPFTIPKSNPFVGRSGALPEIYSYGLRNPWRFSFDRATGALTIADVGQNEFEEINYMAKGKARGANFGWRPFEGFARFTDESAPGAIKPVLTLSHDSGYCSITGGYVVRDKALRGLYGRYVFGDFCKAGIRSVRLKSGKSSGLRAVDGARSISSVSTFGEDAKGRIYVASLQGPVYRLVAR
jgi:glucose/arabinose dehydrogenase